MNIEAGGGLDLEAAALLLGKRLIELGDVGENFRGIDGLQSLARLARLGAGDRQQRIEGLEQLVGFGDRALERILVFGGRPLAQRRFGARLEPGQRTADRESRVDARTRPGL